MISPQQQISRELVMPSDSDSCARATDVGRELGFSSVQPERETVIESRMVADGPAIEAMFPRVGMTRADREVVVVR